MNADLKGHLDRLVARYEQPSFIAADPIAIPHGFDDPRDQEVIGLYAALLAWGRRSTILKKMEELCERMRYRPYEFVLGFRAGPDSERLAGFKHRTFQPEDAFWLTSNLSKVLRRHERLERVFSKHLEPGAEHAGAAIQGFGDSILNLDPGTPARLAKHLGRPSTGSACKRLSMYLRWMVRKGPVDLALWTEIGPEQLILPLDVHSGRTARMLGLLKRPVNDWQAAMELTMQCRLLDRHDPCKYDFAFFGPAVEGQSAEGGLEPPGPGV